MILKQVVFILIVRGGGTYIDRDEDIESIMLRPAVYVVVPFLCCVVPDYEGVFGEFLEETLGVCAVDVEVEGLHWCEEGTE